jgi:prepilin-type N-terminal cleavage/methylation domain-containing protein
MKKAFTLIEVILVIVIMGIISTGTFIFISTIYDEMIQRQAVADMEVGAKVAVEQVAARLSTAIKDSIVAADDPSETDCKGVNQLQMANVADRNNAVLMWIGKSDEANLGLWHTNDYRPGWSGFVDFSASSAAAISTKGSNLANAETIINNVTGLNNSLTTNDATAPIAIYFHGSSANENACTELFGAYNASKMYKVQRDTADATNTRLLKVDKDFANISEQYSMSHSAYALRLVGNQLLLYSFRPWLGETPNSDANPRVLAGHVSRFGFRWDNEMFRINICESRTFDNGFTAEICKERAVF